MVGSHEHDDEFSAGLIIYIARFHRNISGSGIDQQVSGTILLADVWNVCAL